jgi:succinoglycan biosynthesis transport protein ExoP
MAAERHLTLRDYLAPVLARWWLVLGCTLLILAAVLAYSATRPKVYEASTKLFVAQEANTLLGTGAGFSDERTVRNQATLLTSIDVARAVARRIAFAGDPASLAGRVTATSSGGADFIEIDSTGDTAEEAADIANGFAQAFIDLRSEERRKQALDALEKLRDQLEKLPSGPQAQAERQTISADIRQLEIAAQIGAGTARQIDPARPPAGASSPKPLRNTLLALPLALLGSILLAFVLHRLDPRISRVEEAAAIYEKPVIASIVHDDGIECFHDGRPALSDGSKEAFRGLRVNLELASIDRPLRRILVTSASEGEGKSTVVRNLGIALKEAGARVALVDADLRKGSLTALTGVQATGGLVDVLAGDLALEDILKSVEVAAPGAAAMRATNGNGASATAEALTVLPAGTLPANPSAVFGSQAAWELLDAVTDLHDVVLVDTPPLLAVSDAIPLLSWADGVVIVARTGVTDRRVARRAAEIIERVPEANLVGIVVNDLTGSEMTGYGSYYGYGDRGRAPTSAALG